MRNFGHYYGRSDNSCRMVNMGRQKEKEVNAPFSTTNTEQGNVTDNPYLLATGQLYHKNSCIGKGIGGNMPKKARSRPVKKPNSFVLWLDTQVGQRRGIWYKDLATVIGLKPAAFTQRMKSGKFDYLDMVKIFEFLNASDEDILRLMKQKGV